MTDAVNKMKQLAYSVADKGDHEAVEVSVKVIREMAEAMSELDVDRRVRESLEHDVIELQTQRDILTKANDSLHDELKVRSGEVSEARKNLGALWGAFDRMREAICGQVKRLHNGERITDHGDES